MKTVYLLLFCLCGFSVQRISTSDALNNDCELDNNKPGKCIHLKYCKSAIRQIKEQHSFPITCGFNKFEPIVCCEIEDSTKRSREEEEKEKKVKRKTGEISDQKCRNVYQNLKLSMDSPTLGTGGRNAEPKEYAHMAALGYNDENQTVWGCGGSLISDKYVLTAAHCVKSKIFGNISVIRLGDLNLNSTDDDAEPQDIGVKRVIIHPDYKPPLVYNDIALIELDHTVRFSKYILPACLHTEHDIAYKHWSATGWGVTSYNGIPADHLQEMQLVPFSTEECQIAYKDSTKRKLSNGIDHQKQVCAGHDSMDTCAGDSGGPLQKKNEFKFGYTVIGVTSFGKPCGLTKSPGVYTRVSHYLEWIESNVWPE